MPAFLASIAQSSRAHAVRLCCALALIGCAGLPFGVAHAVTIENGIKNYQPFAAEHIGIALAGAKELQAAVKAGDVKAAQAAWIKSRKGWEAAEPITGEFFPKLDDAIDAWPDAKQGYHAIEAALFSGKLDNLSAPVDKLVADLAEFDKQLNAPSFKFTAQGLMNGATKLAYEIGENKAKGGESPYAGTSASDIYENNEGIEAVYKLVFHDTLKSRDPKLDKRIVDQIEVIEGFVRDKSIKQIDAAGLTKAGEEYAVMLQNAAVKLKLKKPTVGE
jgi:iron uptake system EfeUOB component EfeO/EfeM